MTKNNTLKAAALVAAIATPGFAEGSTDYTALREDSRVHNELLGAAIADMIDRRCDSLEIRRLTVATRAFALRSHAMSLGYSNAEIMAYVESEEEQDRFRQIVLPYLESRGGVPGDKSTYCAIGREEMEKRSFVGTMLKPQ